jgi:hypothetical protein
MSDKNKLDKQEKKRLKAQYKLEKKRVKAPEKFEPERLPGALERGEYKVPQRADKIPWYKDPAWLRAIAAIATLIVAIIALIVSLY